MKSQKKSIKKVQKNKVPAKLSESVKTRKNDHVDRITK